MPPGLLCPLPIVMQSPLPVDAIQVPFRHEHELVEHELQALDEMLHMCPQAR